MSTVLLFFCLYVSDYYCEDVAVLIHRDVGFESGNEFGEFTDSEGETCE